MPLVGSCLFRKVSIIGVGLIGGSLGLAIKKRRLAREVVGMAQKASTLQTAVKMGAIDKGFHDVRKAVSNADLVVIATPVSVIMGMLTSLSPHLKRNCVITDVGSAKQAIVNAAAEQLPQPAQFIGSHPLAGSEKKGVQFAREDLFEGSVCIMTPTKSSGRGAQERVKRMWLKCGAKVKTMTPAEHDEILAHTSHLPHLLAYALMESVSPAYLEYAAQGFKDSTRIAASSPQMWSDICLGNSRNILRAMDEMVKQLSLLRKAITLADAKTLVSHFKNAKARRDKIV